MFFFLLSLAVSYYPKVISLLSLYLAKTIYHFVIHTSILFFFFPIDRNTQKHITYCIFIDVIDFMSDIKYNGKFKGDTRRNGRERQRGRIRSMKNFMFFNIIKLFVPKKPILPSTRLGSSSWALTL